MNATKLIKLIALWIISSSLLGHSLFGQELKGNLGRITTPESNYHWIKFTQRLEMTPESFFDLYGADLGLTPLDEMRRVRRHQSQTEGLSYRTYQQYHQGMKVHGATLVFQMWQDEIRTINGDVGADLELSPIPSIDMKTAQEQAIAALAKFDTYKVYDPDNPFSPQQIKFPFKPETVSFDFPIVVVSPSPQTVIERDNLTAAYEIVLISEKGTDIQIVYVDIQNGKMLKTVDGLQGCFDASVWTFANGIQSFKTDNYLGSSPCVPSTGFGLEISCPGSYQLVTERHPLGYSYCSPPDFTQFLSDYYDANNFWASSIGHNDPATVHWIMQEAWDFFEQTFSYSGVDGQGMGLTAQSGLTDQFLIAPVHNGTNNEIWIPIPVASPGPSVTECGTGIVRSVQPGSFATPDIVGHEYTHAVINQGGNLGTQGEANALNEGFADIFGGLIERFIGATDAETFLLGNDVSTEPAFLRSMEDPNNFFRRIVGPNNCVQLGTADEVGQAGFWDPNNNDEYANSGPLAHWFYLLTIGGIHRNGTRVDGVGFSTSTEIAFETMMALPQNGTYVDARNAALSYTEIAFGLCSPTYRSVVQAFNAINVNPSAPVFDIPQVELIGFQVCVGETAEAEAFNLAPGVVYTWSTNPVGAASLTPAGNTCLFVTQSTAPFTLIATPNGTCPIGGELQVQPVIGFGCDGFQFREGQAAAYRIFPNPASDQFTLSFERGEVLDIMDLHGRVIFREMLSPESGRQIIDISELASGIYMTRILGTEGEVMGTEKLVVR
ncbi:MAG: M4 family metallopeptidase [Bacteroidota bacterium]